MSLELTVYRKEYTISALHDILLKDLIEIITDYICDDRSELKDYIRHTLAERNYNWNIGYTVESWDNIVIRYPFSATRISTVFIEISGDYTVIGFLGARDYVGQRLSAASSVLIRSWLHEYSPGHLIDDVTDLVHKIVEATYNYNIHIMHRQVKNDNTQLI